MRGKGRTVLKASRTTDPFFPDQMRNVDEERGADERQDDASGCLGIADATREIGPALGERPTDENEPIDGQSSDRPAREHDDRVFEVLVAFANQRVAKVEKIDGEDVRTEFVHRLNELVEQGEKVEERNNAKIFDE